MKKHYFVILLLMAMSWSPVLAQEVKNLGAHRTDVGLADFQAIIDARCSKCHSRERVDMAFERRQDINKLVNRMLSMGAKVSEGEMEILKTFWQNDALAEVNKIIARRCTLCHDRQRIDEAISRGENLALIQEKMLGFGARLTKAEKDVLGVFTGPALK